MKIKTAWDSTISVIEVLVYRATDKENPRLGRELPTYHLVALKITSFLLQDSKQ
ncbi:hypothetical protein SAMN02787073_0150 [Chryseobacterium vrystaatense]|uniref:Uncharacterized protein n=1 Tax=Chryseobacterium vrystaatense TaxID=307480 RepID=A0A1M5PSV5_9FLAO|nr:hypothetical protein SAMN02787073_0150 [Chryseobacterium vrystaatense]